MVLLWCCIESVVHRVSGAVFASGTVTSVEVELLSYVLIYIYVAYFHCFALYL